MIEDLKIKESYDLYIGGEDEALHISRIYRSLLKDINRTKKTPQYTKVMLRALALRYAECELRWSINTLLWAPLAEHRNTPTDILFQMFETYTINPGRYLSFLGTEVVSCIYHNPNVPPLIKTWICNGGFAGLTFKEYLDGLGYPNSLGDPELKNLKEILDVVSYVVGPKDVISLQFVNVTDTFRGLK
jgi:hypothetical protein